MGLTEAHQVLSMNNLRARVTLRTDGGLRTGRDIVMAAMLGAEEFGIGTAALIAMGCIMVRQCQSNTCPVGVCTQDEALRAKYTGTADKVVNLITFYATEVREILASIGARSLDEVIGRADLLTQVSRGSTHLDDLDLNPLLITVDGARTTVYDREKPRNEVPDTLDAEIVKDAARFLRTGRRCSSPMPCGTPTAPSARASAPTSSSASGCATSSSPTTSRSSSPARPASRSAPSPPPASRSRSPARPTTTSARAFPAAPSS
jgi:hypothetical protein